LKEIFSRFNFVLYKEKEMADFRRWFIALAVLALAAGLASAQVGIAGSTSAGALTCTANGASIPQLRAEGYTELVGDILINCVGGPTYAPNTQIPTTNITVFMSPSTNAITSRLFVSGQAGLSEVALIIDESGSNLPTGVAGNFGPKAPQVLCTTSTGCPAFVGSDPGTSGGPYEVATSTAGGSTNAANVYQGYLNAVGVNTVTFYGVPVLPPVTSGVSRVFRITNIRFPVVGLGNQQQILASVSTSPSTVLPLVQAGFPVGVVISPSLTTSAKLSTANPFAQCQSQSPAQLSATLSYTEGFATAFKTRVVPMTNTPWAAEQQNLTTQNIPGGLYNGFASNSESGFIVNGDGTSTFTAGLSDFGTRLKAVFTNIPAGITLYVSSTSTNGGANPPAFTQGGQTLLSSWAVLVATGSGEATSDGASFSGSSVITTGGVTLGGGIIAVPLAANSSGVATAVWEVTNAQPSANETLTFGVYIAYKANPGAITSANPYGLPQITNILNAPVNNVSMSYAPEPSQGAFSAANGPLPGTNIIPRFSILNPSAAAQFVNIGLCQTTLLYPFITANPAATGLGQGFDTGIAVANTSMDPFASGVIANLTTALNEIGSCTLYPYGFTLSSTGAQTAPPAVLKGCDLISNPVQGQNCFPVVAPGTVQTVLASTVFPNFQGYVIAVCNFQYAHGYAAVTDLGLRGLFSSYLALELAPNSFGSAGRGVSIEQLVH
jgi:hypothetical protein